MTSMSVRLALERHLVEADPRILQMEDTATDELIGDQPPDAKADLANPGKLVRHFRVEIVPQDQAARARALQHFVGVVIDKLGVVDASFVKVFQKNELVQMLEAEIGIGRPTHRCFQIVETADFERVVTYLVERSAHAERKQGTSDSISGEENRHFFVTVYRKEMRNLKRVDFHHGLKDWNRRWTQMNADKVGAR